MSQIKAQKLRLAFQPANLRETLSNALQLLDLHAKKKGIALEARFDPLLPTRFCTDHVRLGQIILNLLNNSIKFTKEGFVRLVASVIEGTSRIKVSVEDSGIGMTKDDVDKLFGIYTHIDLQDRASINPSGVGLGLKIAYDLAKMLGPKDNAGIEVESIPGKGSIFSFILRNNESGVVEKEEEDDYSRMLESEEPEVAEEPKLKKKALRKCSNCVVRWSNDLQKVLDPPHQESPLTLKVEAGSSSPKESGCQCPRVLVVDDSPFNIMAFESVLCSLKIKFDSVYGGKIRNREDAE